MKRRKSAGDLDLKVDLQRAGLAMTVAYFRREAGLAQADLAVRAAISQQQLSRLEKGDNCNMATFLKVCEAMDVELQCVRRKGPGVAKDRQA